MRHGLTQADYLQQINTIQTRCDPPPEAPQWFEDAQTSASFPNISFMSLFRLCDEAARICSSVRALVEEASLKDMFFGATFIAESINDLDKRMQDHFGASVAPPLINSTAESALMNDYITIQDLRIRNYIDACFLRLHYSVLELLFHAARFPGHSGNQLKAIAELRDLNIQLSQARADRILSTLHTFLQDASREISFSNWADSLRLLWQVRLIASSPVLLERQKRVAKSALSTMGHEVGLMQAMGSYLLTLTEYAAL